MTRFTRFQKPKKISKIPGAVLLVLALFCANNQLLTAQTSGTTIFHFPAFRYPDDTVTDSLVVTNAGNEAWESYYDQLDIQDDCAGLVLKSIRQYFIIDWLSNIGPDVYIPSLDLNNDGRLGDAFDAQVFGDSIYMLVDGAQGPVLAPKNSVLHYTQILKWSYGVPPIAYTGTVFEDVDADCIAGADEPRLANWVVKVIAQPSGNIWIDTSDANGFYEIGICLTDTAAEISLDVPYNYGGDCPLVYQLPLLPAGQIAIQDIPVHLQQTCPLLSVDLSASTINACATGRYVVSYCNLSTIPVADAKVAVYLDNYIGFTDASMPATYLGNNAYEFSIGDLDAGRCGEMEITFTTDCNTPAGASFCSEAHISPIAACDTNGVWSGAWLEASAVCDGDSVHLILSNIGAGSMDQPLDFVVVEDLIMYTQPTSFQLGAGEQVEVTLPANGATFYIQSPQVEGHPFGGIVAAQVEGCGGLNLPGASLALPAGSNSPFAAYDCQVNSLQQDGNYVTALPGGYGPQHLINKNTDLKYTIHFQNLAADTARNLTIYVWPPQELDINSIVPGAGSHPFDFDIFDNFIRFRFDLINLPGAATNSWASKGFVSYQIAQMPDLPDGTVIDNQAQLHFENQFPIVTNMVRHEIGSNFIEVASPMSGVSDNAGAPLLTFPNPSTGMVYFHLPEGREGGHFALTDEQGQPLYSGEFAGPEFRLDRQGLPAGVYYYALTDRTRRVYSGKLILHP